MASYDSLMKQRSALPSSTGANVSDTASNLSPEANHMGVRITQRSRRTGSQIGSPTKQAHQFEWRSFIGLRDVERETLSDSHPYSSFTSA